MSSDFSFEGKGIKGAKEQGILRAKYGFIADYEPGYADVAFGELKRRQAGVLSARAFVCLCF